jgi:hypothetical protein
VVDGSENGGQLAGAELPEHLLLLLHVLPILVQRVLLRHLRLVLKLVAYVASACLKRRQSFFVSGLDGLGIDILMVYSKLRLSRSFHVLHLCLFGNHHFSRVLLLGPRIPFAFTAEA